MPAIEKMALPSPRSPIMKENLFNNSARGLLDSSLNKRQSEGMRVKSKLLELTGMMDQASERMSVLSEREKINRGMVA